MLNFIRRYKLKKALSSYVYKLGPALLKRYGSPEQYTVPQIQQTAKLLKIDNGYLAYAVAMYRHEVSVNTIKLLQLDQQLLDALRAELATALFDGNTNYRARDVIKLAKRSGWQGGAAPNWMANKNGQSSL